MTKDFLDRIGHALNIYHTQYYTDELTDTIFFVTQQKYAGVMKRAMFSSVLWNETTPK